MVAAGRDKGELAGGAGGASQGDMASCHKHDPREALHENWERIDKEFFRSISENDVDGLRLQVSALDDASISLHSRRSSSSTLRSLCVSVCPSYVLTAK